MKHGRSVSATARQRMYCASNLRQGGGEPKVPAPCISPEKGKVMERFKEVLKKRWRKPRDAHRLMDKPVEKEIDTIPDASFTSFICFS